MLYCFFIPFLPSSIGRGIRCAYATTDCVVVQQVWRINKHSSKAWRAQMAGSVHSVLRLSEHRAAILIRNNVIMEVSCHSRCLTTEMSALAYPFTWYRILLIIILAHRVTSCDRWENVYGYLSPFAFRSRATRASIWKSWDVSSLLAISLEGSQ